VRSITDGNSGPVADGSSMPLRSPTLEPATPQQGRTPGRAVVLQRQVSIRRVRCRACTHTYTKPIGMRLDLDNPGCPSCGYLGWM
jgi:hypothetical protein